MTRDAAQAASDLVRRAAGLLAQELSVKEASVLAGVTEKTIRHEFAARIARPKRRAARRLALGPDAVFYFSLVANLPVELTKSSSCRHRR